METAWIIPLFPLASFVLLLVFGKKLKESSAYVGIAMTLLSFAFAVVALVDRFAIADIQSRSRMADDWGCAADSGI